MTLFGKAKNKIETKIATEIVEKVATHFQDPLEVKAALDHIYPTEQNAKPFIVAIRGVFVLAIAAALQSLATQLQAGNHDYKQIVAPMAAAFLSAIISWLVPNPTNKV